MSRWPFWSALLALDPRWDAEYRARTSSLLFRLLGLEVEVPEALASELPGESCRMLADFVTSAARLGIRSRVLVRGRRDGEVDLEVVLPSTES